MEWIEVNGLMSLDKNLFYLITDGDDICIAKPAIDRGYFSHKNTWIVHQYVTGRFTSPEHKMLSGFIKYIKEYNPESDTFPSIDILDEHTGKEKERCCETCRYWSATRERKVGNAPSYI